jgi:transcriptional regulator with XRE-family HTH domain
MHGHTEGSAQDIGEFIRDLRQTAKISLRQLADEAGVSNPYLSQIERGLRKPSAEVLQQLASALRVSTPAMYLRAGLLDSEGQQGVLAAIAVDPELTIAQKQSLSQIYETFRNENAPSRAPGPRSRWGNELAAVIEDVASWKTAPRRTQDHNHTRGDERTDQTKPLPSPPLRRAGVVTGVPAAPQSCPR